MSTTTCRRSSHVMEQHIIIETVWTLFDQERVRGNGITLRTPTDNSRRTTQTKWLLTVR